MNQPTATSHPGATQKNSSILPSPAPMPIMPANTTVSNGALPGMALQQPMQFTANQPQQQQLMQQQQHMQQLQQQQAEYQRRHQQQLQNQQQVPNQQQQQQQHSHPQQMQQTQMNHQQHLPHNSLNGGWQSDKDMDARKKMISRIVQLLQQRKPNAPADWLQKLPQMAKRLEENLYKAAPSFESYNNYETLKTRLQKLAQQIKPRKPMPPNGMSGTPQQNQQIPAPNPGVQSNQQLPMGQMGSNMPPTMIHNNNNHNNNNNNNSNNNTINKTQQQSQYSMQKQQLQQPPSRQMVNMSDINPIIMPSQPMNPSQNLPNIPQVTPGTYVPQNINSNNSGMNSSNMMNGGMQPIPAPGSSAAPNMSSAVDSRPDRQQVLRHQQQRLLLLRHAAKCPFDDNRCPVTPHCSGMKRLWKHIAECKDQKCQVPHCVSSRYVLSHYHRCKEQTCPVCGPVREAIHRSHQRQKEMSSLKQNQLLALQQNPNNDVNQPQTVNIVPQNINNAQPIAPNTSNVMPPPKRQKTESPTISAQPQMPLKQSIPNQSSQPLPVQSNPAQKQLPVPSQPTAVIIPPTASLARVASKPTSKPQEVLTLINCLTLDQIEKHIESLNRGLQLPPAKLKIKCLEVLKGLQLHPHGWVFNSPVDPVELGLHDYFEVIRNPMDLGTIKKKLENGCYHSSLEDFEADVNLTFDNAMLYNPEGSVVNNMAKEMLEKFKDDFGKLLKQLQEEEDEKRKKGDACSLCGSEKLNFEPPIFYCNGITCSSKRIRRNSYYYVGGKNKYHWCHQCYGELKENQSIQMPDCTIKKETLQKKKNDEVREESWVHCDRCNRWIHQICGLFNTRENKDTRSEYVCPRCTVDERKKSGKSEGTSRMPMAEDLQRTKLSEYLEAHVSKKVEEYYDIAAKEKAEAESISFEEARKVVSSGGAITIRQTTSMDRKLEVRERMKSRYAFKNYPSEFTFRCKCIIVFQNLDGVDVILFGLYVYEHDEKNPPPNKNLVYISYLDSVHFMRPRKMRTFVYHEILLAYLDYVRRKGFATAHIWACPPLKGDDYILYAKPEDQKTPRDDRLRQWYFDMLEEAQRRGLVGKVTNMYDLYFANTKFDATVVPYLDGDYFPAEVENIIKTMEEGKTGKKSSSDDKKKKAKSKNKSKAGRGGTRSAGLDEEAFAASGLLPPGFDQKSLMEGKHDYVMQKLGETIHPMKDSFIVAYLAHEGAKEEDMVVPKAIQEYREEHGITHKLSNEGATEKKVKEEPKAEPSAVKQEAGSENQTDSSKEEKPDTDEGVPESSQDVVMENGSNIKEEQDDKAVTNGHNTEKAVVSSTDPKQTDVATEDDTAPKAQASSSMLSARGGKFAAMEARKRSLEGTPKTEATAVSVPSSSKVSTTTTVKDSKGRIVKVIDDDVEEMDCEFLNNRQLFLELCQTNNYQFDQLRRAKHSSMMVLFHLHNRDAPKFVQQCTVCSREILTGNRYHCNTCDFDMCQECFQNPSVPRHPHLPLTPIPVSGQQNEITEEERKKRQKAVELHLTLLQHAATCNDIKCRSNNCTKMKGLLKHGDSCTIKASGGCNVCKRILALLQLHARQCKVTNCPVFKCNAIRERYRQITEQQRAMDDRRRQQMNKAYSRTAST